MARSGYVVTTESAVQLSTAAKSILGVRAGGNFGVDLNKVRIGFDGTSATATPVTVELCLASFDTNPPGTSSTSVTVRQEYGRLPATGFTAARNWTSEPTVLQPIEEWYLTPNGGLVVYDYPLGTSPDSPIGEGFVLRCTASQAVNVRAVMHFERA